MRHEKSYKIIFQSIDTEDVQSRLDDAFDLLFDEACKELLKDGIQEEDMQLVPEVIAHMI